MVQYGFRSTVDETESMIRKGKNMKKRLAAGVLSVILAVSLAGCGSGLSNEYVSVKKYKGLEVTPVEAEEVTSETVQEMIDEMLESTQTQEEVTGRPAQNGDIVNIDFTGSFDGEVFEGGSATGTDLELGAGGFIGATEDYKGFEEQIVGHSKGEEFDITVQFPDPYSQNTDYSGKVAVFRIKLNGIYTKIIPELTDEWVQANSQESKTVDEYRDEIEDYLEERNEYNAHNDTVNEVYNALLEHIEVKSYPDGAVEEQKTALNNRYQSYASQYGMSMSDFLKYYMNTTEEGFAEQVQTAAENTVKIEQACELIAEKEKLESTGEEYEEDVKELAETVGYEDVEQFKQAYSEEVIKQTLRQEKVAEYLLEKSVKPSNK